MITKEQLSQIVTLQELCEQYDQIQLKLNIDMLEKREHSKDDFFFYEENELIGFLALYGFGDSYELCGMVHPNHRRKGIFSGLFKDAIASLKSRSIQTLLINIPASSKSGKAFLETQPCQYDFSEYQMKWAPQDIHTNNIDISLRDANASDIEKVIQIDVECFHISKNDATSFTKNIFKNENEKKYMIEFEGKTVGKINVQRREDHSYIYGFAVLPEYQGRGIGRHALANTVIQEKGISKAIFLEVATKNANALKLYEGVGFKSYETQDYYKYSF